MMMILLSFVGSLTRMLLTELRASMHGQNEEAGVMFAGREYNGELRQRISVASLKPVVYAEEVRRLLQDIQKLQVA